MSKYMLIMRNSGSETNFEDMDFEAVINAMGAVSLRGPGGDGLRQRLLLEAEGVEFDARGRVNLSRYQWRPRGA